MSALRRFFDSMTGRVFVILLVGVAVSAAVAWTLADGKRQADLSRIDLDRAAERVQQAVMLWEAAQTTEARAALIARGSGRGGMRVADEGLRPLAEDAPFTAAIRELLPTRTVRAQKLSAEACRTPGPIRRDGLPDIQITRQCWLVTVGATSPLRLVVETPPRPRGDPLLFEPLYIVILIVAAAALSLLVARIATAPLATLSTAAAGLGADLQRTPMPVGGPIEVRRAAEAFNAMQARLQRQLAERMHMLAAITHDLQTPVTRLRLRIDRVQDQTLRDRLLMDLGAMQTLIREGLELARTSERSEAASRLDLRSLLESLVEDAADAGQDVTLASATDADVKARPDALKRVLSNLIENALKYGGSARVSAALEDGAPVVRIRDDGPGIPDDQLDAVFSPFVRLEDSRSRDTGGVGLGLTIARTLAERDGATVELRNHPQGGAEAIVRLSAA